MRQVTLSFLKLQQAAGDLGKVASLEKEEGEAHSAIAPATHQKKTAQEKGQATPRGGDQAVFEALVWLLASIGLEAMAMAEEAISFPGGVVVVLEHVAVDAP